MNFRLMKVRRYIGYPKQVLWELVSGWLVGIGLLALGMFLAALPVLNFIEIWQRQEDYPELGAWIGAILGVALCALFTYITVTSVLELITGNSVMIVPYFEQAVGASTFACGGEVARSCRYLDDLAINAREKPISAFGFHDDLSGDTLVWHLPQEGLRTFATLIAEIESADLAGDRRLLFELRLIKHALLNAEAQGTRFCLLIRGGYTNQLEHERRQGSFF